MATDSELMYWDGPTTITIYFTNGTTLEFSDCTGIGYSPDEIRFTSGGSYHVFKIGNGGAAGYSQSPPPGGSD